MINPIWAEKMIAMGFGVSISANTGRPICFTPVGQALLAERKGIAGPVYLPKGWKRYVGTLPRRHHRKCMADAQA